MTIEIRPVSGMAELERWVAIHNEVEPDDTVTTDAKALVRALQSERADLLAYVDGVPVGAAVMSGDAESRDSGRPYFQVDVLPAYRGRGVGGALLRAVSEEARRFGHAELLADVDADDAYSFSFLERRGFVEHRRWQKLELDLAAHDSAAPEPVDGVEIASLTERPELLEGMHRVAAEVYPELGGYVARQAESFLEWQVYTFADTPTVLELVLLAVAGDEVVAFGTAKDHYEAVAELRMVAVKPAWRGRGVASALVAAQIERARRLRPGRLIAFVAEDGEAAHVYRGLGFEHAGGVVEVRGPLLS